MLNRGIRLLSSLARGCIRANSTVAMSRKLEGKVAVVTASTDGIGLAIARRLGQDGAKVVVSSRRGKNVRRAVEELQNENIAVHGVVCHVGKPEDRTKLIEETNAAFGGIDILVSNAGMNAAFGPILDTTEDQWDKIFDINLKSTFFMCKEVVPCIEKRGGGSIVLVSSIAGFVPINFIGAYSISKTALLGMVKAMSTELAASNIRINGVAPGIIKTRFSEALVSDEGIVEEQTKHIPLKRFGMPEDISGLVSFLVSEDAAYMTGENVVAAGGMTSRL